MSDHTPAPVPDVTPDELRVQMLASALRITPGLTERLQRLRESVTGTLHDEFSIVATDLDQLRAIFSDAANKLSSGFQTMNARSDEMRRTVAALQSEPDRAALDRISAIACDMTATTGTTIQSLQFEDMASQLLAHVHRKLDILERFSREMAVINPDQLQCPPLLSEAELVGLEHALTEYQGELQRAARKTVQQQSLDSGDIELF